MLYRFFPKQILGKNASNVWNRAKCIQWSNICYGFQQISMFLCCKEYSWKMCEVDVDFNETFRMNCDLSRVAVVVVFFFSGKEK